MSEKFSKIEISDKWAIFLSVDGKAEPFATRYDAKIYGLDNIHTNAAWKIQSLQERNQVLTEALKPFAQFACDLSEGETCDCFNCRAEQAIALNRGKQ